MKRDFRRSRAAARVVERAAARGVERAVVRWVERATARAVEGSIIAALVLTWAPSTGHAAVIETKWLWPSAGQLMSQGTMQVNGTLGDVFVGPASAGSIVLWSGFWTPLAGGPAVVEPAAAAPGFALGLPQPNPVCAATLIDFSLPYSSTGSLTIFDTQGRIVRRLFRGTAQPGATALVWDLQDDARHPVPQGVYFCRLQFPPFTARRQLVISR